jgi:phosphoenolpyruvate-protein kinase (PTS system EI component)
MIDIVIPMISDPSEVCHVRSVMESETARLKEEGIPHGAPKLGAMIEVPAAVFIAEEIAAESDFLSLGTNDLIQYLLAVDRDNENVSGWFRTLHPSVLRAIKHVIDSAKGTRKPLIICGEMAGSPYYVPVLIGLGATDLSMTVNSLGRVRRVIEGIDSTEARTFADELLSSGTADSVESLVKDRNSAKWTHLFDEGPAVQK